MAKIPAPFNLELNDGHSRGQWRFQVNPGTIDISWLTQDQFSIVLNSEGRKIGDFDEQRDWSGGRGGERFSDDPTKYKDAKEAGTWIPGHIFPSLQWKIAAGGHRSAIQNLPGAVSWRGLFGDTQSRSMSFTASAFNADKVWLWVRRVGTPGTLTVELRSDSSGSPGSVLKTVDVTTSDITDVISVFKSFDWTGTQALSNGVVYHIVACGADADTKNSHWEIGGVSAASAGKYSASGAGDAGSWSVADFSVYYRITDADVGQRWWFFNQGTNFCKVSNEATATLCRWNESSVAWDVISSGTHGLGQVTGRPIEVNGIVYFPQGDSVAIRTWDGTNWDSQTIATGQGCATGLAVGYIAASNKTQIWRFNNALVSGGTTTGLKVSVSRADAVAAYTTDLAFGASTLIGETSWPINRIMSVNNVLRVYKGNSLGMVENDRYTELDFGIRKSPSLDNGIASISWNSFIFFNWLHSTQREYSGTVDDVGQGFKGPALPDGREGVDSAYATYIAWMFIAQDAGLSGTSSVMLYDGLNRHEFARAWASGRRIRDVFIQTQPAQLDVTARASLKRNRLWFDCGGDSCYIELPFMKGNPLDDSGARYMHECVIESSEIDMGTASKLPKYIDDLTMTSKNLNGNGIRVDVDYQVDDEVGKTWYGNSLINAGSFTKSPEDSININVSNIHKFAYRFRIQTDNNAIPPDIRGVVPSGFARSSMKKVISVEAIVKNVTVNGKKTEAKDVLEWLEEAGQNAYLINTKSTFWQLNDFRCIVAPPSIYPIKANPEADKVTFSLLVF